MPKRSSNQPARSGDPNVLALQVVQEAVGQPMPPKPEKNPAAVALGKLGGQKGGKARAAKLTPEERSRIAKEAAEARWKKDKE